MKNLQTKIQYVLPHHALSTLVGMLADSKISWWKNAMIRFFIKQHPAVDMKPAIIEDPYQYASFNEFFIRLLKPESRPIAANQNAIVSPVDGLLLQKGDIDQQQLLQAKGFYYNLQSLLGGDKTLSEYFADGTYFTFYLAPHNYHRIHLPITGRLLKTIFVPGNLFAVNTPATEIIPELYTRNERLICLFDTAIGQVAVILVGAFIVGSIKTVWKEKPYHAKEVLIESPADTIEIAKGGELGYFKMGSTVILLFAKQRISLSTLTSATVQMGQEIAQIK